MNNDYTFTFSVDPKLNGGITEVFNQCGEPWWWAEKDGEVIGAGGDTLNLTGATFKSLHVGSTLVLGRDKCTLS